MPLMKPVAGSDAPRPLKTEQDEQRYTPTPRRESLLVPTPDIFDEPTRCLKINLEWWSHISGMIDVLSSPELWQGDDDDKTRAIRAIAALLAFNECGGFDMTPEELTEAICAANRCTLEEFAKRYLSGSTTNIVIDEDGNVTTPDDDPADSVELPEDDPSTPLIDETLAAKAGGVINVRLKITEILADMDTWFTGAITEATAVSRLILLYGFEAGANLDAFVNYYYLTYATPANPIVILDSLDSILFCRGLTTQSFSNYALKIHTPAGDRETLLKLVPCLTPALLSEWYESGIDTPSTDYFNYSCVLAEPETIIISTTGTSYTTLTQWKPFHRLRITASGVFTDPAGIQRDFWYYKSAAGVVSNVIASTTVTVGVAVPKPTTTENPYNPSHVYTFTTETTLGSAMVLNVGAGGVLNAPLTGVITVLIEDLGEIGV